MGKKYIRYLYDKNMYPEFSQRLKEARKNKKLSQQNVADQIGCSRTLYQQMEAHPRYSMRMSWEMFSEKKFSMYFHMISIATPMSLSWYVWQSSTKIIKRLQIR